jgi:hypothetical protein
MEMRFTPGTWVRLPSEPDWGLGQVQSAIGDTITVNFAEAGKRVINTAAADLVEVTADEMSRGGIIR